MTSERDKGLTGTLSEGVKSAADTAGSVGSPVGSAGAALLVLAALLRQAPGSQVIRRAVLAPGTWRSPAAPRNCTTASRMWPVPRVAPSDSEPPWGFTGTRPSMTMRLPSGSQLSARNFAASPGLQ